MAGTLQKSLVEKTAIKTLHFQMYSVGVERNIHNYIPINYVIDKDLEELCVNT